MLCVANSSISFFFFPWQNIFSILLVQLFSYKMQLTADVATNWLTFFPFSAKKLVYDVFFVHGLIPEVVQILTLSLQHNGSDSPDINSVLSNSERCDC